MPSAENIALSVGIDAGDTLAVLQNINKNIESMAKTSVDTAKKTENAFAKITQQIKAMLSIGAVIGVFKKAIGEATDAAKAQIVLENALKRVGLQYKDVADQVERIAGMNAVDDDDVKKVMAFAASLGVPKQRLAEFVETAYDFSAATGKEISLAMRTMSTAAKEGGAEWENWKNRLQGAGEAAANADGGIKNLGKQVNDLYEKLGKALMPVVTVVVGLLIRLADVLQGMPLPIVAVTSVVAGLTIVMKALNLTSPFGWITIAVAGFATLIASIASTRKELKLLNGEELESRKALKEARLKKLQDDTAAWESSKTDKTGLLAQASYKAQKAEIVKLKTELAEIAKLEADRAKSANETTGEYKQQAAIPWQGPKKGDGRAPNRYDNSDVPKSAKEYGQDYYRQQDITEAAKEAITTINQVTGAAESLVGNLEKAGIMTKEQADTARNAIDGVKTAVGTVGSFLTGNVVGGITGIIDLAVGGISALIEEANRGKREEEEGIKKQAEIAADQLKVMMEQLELQKVALKMASEAYEKRFDIKTAGMSATEKASYASTELAIAEEAMKKLEALNNAGTTFSFTVGGGQTSAQQSQAAYEARQLRLAQIAEYEEYIKFLNETKELTEAGNFDFETSGITPWTVDNLKIQVEELTNLETMTRLIKEGKQDQVDYNLELASALQTQIEQIEEFMSADKKVLEIEKEKTASLREQQSLLEKNLQTLIGAALINPENLADIQRIKSLMGQYGYSGAGMVSGLSGLGVRGLDGGGRSISIANLNLEVNEATGATVEATMAADVYGLFSGGRR